MPDFLWLPVASALHPSVSSRLGNFRVTLDTDKQEAQRPETKLFRAFGLSRIQEKSSYTPRSTG